VTKKDIKQKARIYMSRAIEAERRLGYSGRVSRDAYRRATDRTAAAIQELAQAAARMR
jgi:hypothetical protein